MTAGTLKQKRQFAHVKVKLSTHTVWWVLRHRWWYGVVAVFAAVTFFELIYWMLNAELFGVLMLSGALTMSDKLSLLTDPVRSIVTTNGAVVGVSVAVLSVVQGITIAVLVFVMRHQRRADMKSIGGSSVAGLLAAVGMGCPSCGTSVVSPIVSLFVSGSSAGIAERITTVAMPVGLAVGVYALYVTGLRAATSRARMELATENEAI